MTRDGLRGHQQARTDVFAQVDVWFGASSGSALVSRRRMVMKSAMKLRQLLAVLPPLADRAGEFAAVLIHRRFVGIVIRQTQVIHLIGQLIDLEDDAVVIDWVSVSVLMSSVMARRTSSRLGSFMSAGLASALSAARRRW